MAAPTSLSIYAPYYKMLTQKAKAFFLPRYRAGARAMLGRLSEYIALIFESVGHDASPLHLFTSIEDA